MKRCLLWIVVFFLSGENAVPSSAQDQQKGENQSAQRLPEQPVPKIFEIKYADVNRLAAVFSAFGYPVNPDPVLRILTVNAPRDVVVAIEDAIKRLDLPPSPPPPTMNIEITTYLILASSQALPDKTPSELDSVIRQLKGTFKYESFRLLDTVAVRCRDGMQGEVNGAVPRNQEETYPTTYSFYFRSARVDSEVTERKVRIDGLRLQVKTPVRTGGGIEAGISTDIDVREGQKVVVGKATIDGLNNALFLVLTAKVVE